MSFHARGFTRNAIPLAANPSLAAMVEVSRRTPILSAEEETRQFLRWREDGDPAALDIIVRAHMRLVLSRAARYRNYGLPMDDLVMDGYVGFVEKKPYLEAEPVPPKVLGLRAPERP